MAYLLPISIPDVLIRERGVVPANDFAHRHASIAFGPTGRAYLFSELFYNYYRYDNTDNRDLNTHLVTIFDREWQIERVVILEDVMHEMTHDDAGNYVFNNTHARPTITPTGDVVFSCSDRPAIILDPELATRRPPRPRGGLLATHDGAEIVVRDGDLLSIDGHEVGSLIKGEETYATRVEFTEYRGYAGEITALDRDRICISHYASMSRGGFLDHGAFRYTLLDHAGVIVARLPLGEADSPYRPTNAPHHGCFPARALDGWITRSAAAFHLFDRDGTRTLRVGVVDDLEPIEPLALLGAAPTGELLLVHRKHHTLAITDPVRAAGDLEPALVAIAQAYKAEYARLKKAVPWEKTRFLGFEPASPRLGSAPAKPKKSKAKAPVAVVEAAAPQPTADPGIAMANAPYDLETVAVFGDWLGQRGDAIESQIGAFITLRCQIERGACPDRRRLVGLANAMWREHGDGWLARWNDPVKLFERSARFGGLPQTARVETTSNLPDVERQVARLPIRELAIRDLGAKAIARVVELDVLHRVPELSISAGSKTKLGSTLVEWLAGAGLTRLAKLSLYPVETSPKNLRALVDSLPSLTDLGLTKCDLTIDSIDALADTAATARLETLGLAYNPIGSAVMPSLAKFSKLRGLGLRSCDIGDDVAAEAFGELPVEELDLGGCERLGPIALAALVRAMPRLRKLELPSHVRPAHIDTLLPIAHRLESIDFGFANAETVVAFVDRLLPHAPKLHEIQAYHAAGLAGALLAHAPLTKLELGEITDDDVLAISNTPRAAALETLEVDGAFTAATLRALATSPHLANVRNLDVQSAGVDAASLGLALALPSLERLVIVNATIDDAAPLCAHPADLQLITMRCKIGKAAQKQLVAHWGNLYS